MKIKEVLEAIETEAPSGLQESYDNAGLVVGNPEERLTGVLLTLDVGENTIQEAVQKNCNLIVSHHPVIFKGIKRIDENQPEDRILIQAIRNGIALYAAHTNLDNAPRGVNYQLAKQMGLQNIKPLQPLSECIGKLVTFVPQDHEQEVRQALFDAGAGCIGNYDSCSFTSQGEGSFRGNEHTNPYRGKKEVLHREPEVKIEVVYPIYAEQSILTRLYEVHPYEEPATDLYMLRNKHLTAGSGAIGELPAQEPMTAFLERIKKQWKLNVIRHSPIHKEHVQKVAVCGGAGSFLIPEAQRQNADLFLTADLKYHDFFTPDHRITIADIGHFESEYIAIKILNDIISHKLCNFAPHISETTCNPVKYI